MLVILAAFMIVAPMLGPVAGVAIAIPFVILGLAVAALALALVAAILGAPAMLSFWLIRRQMRQRRENARSAEPELELGPEALLRRRYVAGEIGYEQFQQEMMGRLKDRFARGELGVSDYEREIEKLLEPARRLDVKRDPSLAGASRLPAR